MPPLVVRPVAHVMIQSDAASRVLSRRGNEELRPSQSKEEITLNVGRTFRYVSATELASDAVYDRILFCS